MKTVAFLLVVVLLLLTAGLAAADTSITRVIPPDVGDGPPRGGIRLVPPGEDPRVAIPIAVPLNLVERPGSDCPPKMAEGGIWIVPDCGNPQGFSGLNTSGLR